MSRIELNNEFNNMYINQCISLSKDYAKDFFSSEANVKMLESNNFDLLFTE